VIDDAESLVFWLSMTDSNEKYPFLSYVPWAPAGAPLTVNAKRYYDFDETRLVLTSAAATATANAPASNELKSFVAKFCQETCYIYIDSRSYDRPVNEFWDVGRFLADGVPPGAPYGSDTFAFSRATNGLVRPYWTASKNPNAPGTTASIYRNFYKPVNSTTFQLICAGQDGDFGYEPSDIEVKVYNTGENYTEGDKDNIANFSGGKTLADAIP
jgi:hypothetical protein